MCCSYCELAGNTVVLFIAIEVLSNIFKGLVAYYGIDKDLDAQI
jgi:hypothetical protein